jgi:uncharacterized repeat protein (TIGR04042 family)
MPEMTFILRWPDATEQTCYSPSTVIKEHLKAGESYALADFLAQSRIALHMASDRVRAKFGMPCTRALGQLADIEQRATRFSAQPDAQIAILAFHDMHRNDQP